MANKRSKGQLVLLELIKKKKMLPDKNEIFDIYVGWVCREKCGFVGTGFKPFYYERDSEQLKELSFTWYRSALGSLIIKGELCLNLKDL